MQINTTTPTTPITKLDELAAALEETIELVLAYQARRKLLEAEIVRAVGNSGSTETHYYRITTKTTKRLTFNATREELFNIELNVGAAMFFKLFNVTYKPNLDVFESIYENAPQTYAALSDYLTEETAAPVVNVQLKKQEAIH